MVSENDIIYTLCLTGQGGHTVFNIEKSVWDFLSSFRPNLVKLVLRLLSLIHILIRCSLNVIFFGYYYVQGNSFRSIALLSCCVKSPFLDLFLYLIYLNKRPLITPPPNFKCPRAQKEITGVFPRAAETIVNTC